MIQTEDDISKMCSHFDEMILGFAEKYNMDYTQLAAVAFGRITRMSIEYGFQEEAKVLLLKALESVKI